MEATDLEIIRKCLDGEQQYFEVLVTRYKRLIYSVVYNMVNDKEETTDISQEVFIRIYKALERYNPEYKFSTWAVRIATNLCLDIKRKKKLESVPIDEISELPTANTETPEAKYISRERSLRLKKAVEGLPEKYRIPLVMFHQNGLSYEEMTRVLNEPMTIIKNRLYRARLMLREVLQNERKEEVL